MFEFAFISSKMPRERKVSGGFPGGEERGE
jgi:hypothetical protein